MHCFCLVLQNDGTKILNLKSTVAQKNMVSLAKLLNIRQGIKKCIKTWG
jgi:hypothetical protein